MTKLIDAFAPINIFSKGNSIKRYTAIHSGNVGDIIYSLPAAKLLGVNSFVLNVCVDPRCGRILTENSAISLAPLLLEQDWIEQVQIVKSNLPLEFTTEAAIGVDINFDRFRICNTDSRIHLLFRHALPFNITVETSKPWLHINPAEKILFNTPYLAVCLTARYRRFNKSYYDELLADIPPENIVFIGTYQDQIERINSSGHTFIAKDFLELAQVISQANLFIGNPSGSYTIAEALKIPRLVELSEDNNVYPLDSSGKVLHMYSKEYIKSLIIECLNLGNQSLFLANELQKARHEIAELQKARCEIAELQKARHEIDAILSSRTWRYANIIKKPLKACLAIRRALIG